MNATVSNAGASCMMLEHVNVLNARACMRSALVLALVCAPLPAAAESQRREQLRTDEAATPEPMTDKPLKVALQNLFLQEDPFPQQHFQLQLSARVVALGLTPEPSLGTQLGAELGLVDSWSVSVHAPVSWLPGDERGFGNADLAALYCPWVSEHEDLRVTAMVRTVFPSPSSAGDNAFGHDLSVIGYARAAPFHFQAVATLDVSYGKDIASGPRARPEGSLAAILRLEHMALVAEAAFQRELSEHRYLGALGLFVYPGNFELGVAATLDVTRAPVTWGVTGIVSYAFDPPA